MENFEIRERMQKQILECRKILELKKNLTLAEQAEEALFRFEDRIRAYADAVHEADIEGEENERALRLVYLSRCLLEEKRKEFRLAPLPSNIMDYMNKLPDWPDDLEGGTRVFAYLKPTSPPRWGSDEKPIPRPDMVTDDLGDARI